MKDYFIVIAEGYKYPLEIFIGEGAEAEARELAKEYAQKKKQRFLVMRPIGYAEPAIRWKSVP